MKLKAAYTVSELVEATGLSRWQVARLLKGAGVPKLQRRGRRLIWVSTLKKSLPDLWDSLVYIAQASEGR